MLLGPEAHGDRGEREVERAALIHPGAGNEATNLDVHMHHGKKREIRLLFTTLGYDVKRLRRYQIGAFPLKGIPTRAMKKLSAKEIELLFQNPRTPRATLEATTLELSDTPLIHED